MVRAATEVGAASISTIAPLLGVSAGWDAADAETAGWDEKRAAELSRPPFRRMAGVGGNAMT